MTANFLLLSSDKTNPIYFELEHFRNRVSSFKNWVAFSLTMRNFGVIFDMGWLLKTHIEKVPRNAFLQLCSKEVKISKLRVM